MIRGIRAERRGEGGRFRRGAEAKLVQVNEDLAQVRKRLRMMTQELLELYERFPKRPSSA